MERITASLVLYKTKEDDLLEITNCVEESIITTLYVIDNSPTDVLRKLVEKKDKIEYVFVHGNIGYGKGHNIGIRKALEENATYHIVLNPDIRFNSFSIECIKSFADRHKEVGMVLPRVIYPNGDLQYLCKLLPSPLDIFGRRLFPSKIMERRNVKYEMREMGYNRIWNCPILSGCFMFLRVSTLSKCGCFDEQFFMYFEDFDLIRRLHRESKTVFFPNVTIVHKHASEHHTNKALFKASIRSAIQYFNKWGWVFDAERRRINKNALSSENLIID